jgi:hypothetical protein
LIERGEQSRRGADADSQENNDAQGQARRASDRAESLAKINVQHRQASPDASYYSALWRSPADISTLSVFHREGSRIHALWRKEL